MAPARRRGARAAPRYVEARFRADPWVTRSTLRSRGQAMELRGEGGAGTLDRPSLVSSAHGGIGRVLLTLPWWLFLEEGETGAEEQMPAQATAAALRGMMRSLPAETRFVLVTHEEARTEDGTAFDPAARLRGWLSADGTEARAEIVAAPRHMGFTIWAEDAFAVSRDARDSETFLVEPASFRRADDSLVADLVAPRTDLELTQAELYFQGGNILVGDEFWLIGMDYPLRSLDLGYVRPKRGESRAAAVARAYGAALDGGKELLTIGARVPVPGFPGGALVQAFDMDGERWKEILYSGNDEGTVQPIFHIDMFLTLAGKDAAGRYVVLVGDPRMAAEILGERAPRAAMVEVFDDIARQLGEMGFRVVRNPLPLTYDDDEEVRLRTWYFASANNALVQITAGTKDVWLPTYGVRKWPELAATDAANRSIWEGLGFEVHELGDFHPFAVNLGAAHCVKKYLARI